VIGTVENTTTVSTGTAAAPARALRRTVTVLFIDIVGFTALVDRLDPEDVWALQKDYFAVVARAVRASGGVVEKYIGDAVMAVFGAHPSGPYHRDTADSVALEAFHAVQAGLRMQEALRDYPLAGRFPVRTRVGLATGDAIVDLDAVLNGGQAMISGSVVATASRLQAYAPQGTVVVCAATRQATDALVAYQELPPAVVAGKAYPVDLWRALAPQPVAAAAPAPAADCSPRPVRAADRTGPTGAGAVRSASGIVTDRGAAVHARAGP
jgi:class 3 adenylate cyclase